jgi:folate-dependent phosphoribosylglycinamide formyltransferase PurN
MSEIVLMCGASDSSIAVANALLREFGQIPILVERKEPRSLFLRRRLKRLGLPTVAGQIAFNAVIAPVLRRRSRARIGQIVGEGGLELDRSALDRAMHVDSVNSPEAVRWLARERPRVVVVNGTRIIGRRTLAATDAVFINTHCGITPQYRGAHGGYWALWADDPEHCGVTVHVVDRGVDTGDVIAQSRVSPGPDDNFATYPYLQLAAGIPLLLDAVRTAARGRLLTVRREGDGALWYHPTIWQYLASGVRRRLW